MVKIETNKIVNLRTNSEMESVKIGFIDKKGSLEFIEFKYNVENGKVKAL